MNNAVRAIAGGIAGTAVLTAGLVITDVETGYQVGIFETIASFVGTPGQVTLGFVLFLLAGAVAWPLVFLALRQTFSSDRDPAIEGTALGVLLWVAFNVTSTSGVEGVLLIPYYAFTLVAHLAYGYILGAVYAQLGNANEEVPKSAETA
ncbi:DUF6789 family protein [Halorussus halophilus]|uniref:DUF6789 family protein n=1 Tax=Halorussus halophilus TaxID=2650975 RepID=UPI001300E26C|nr:DUF6789 family protein [Halorussus halophilus]